MFAAAVSADDAVCYWVTKTYILYVYLYSLFDAKTQIKKYNEKGGELEQQVILYVVYTINPQLCVGAI